MDEIKDRAVAALTQRLAEAGFTPTAAARIARARHNGPVVITLGEGLLLAIDVEISVDQEAW